MGRKNIELLDDSVKALQNCSNSLNKIAETCCAPERSPNMKEAQLLLDNIISVAKESYTNEQSAYKCIEYIGGLGSKIGFLYATCCTPTREPMYQSIFTNLILVHGNMYGVLGHSH